MSEAHQLYEQMKADWLARNPNATPNEYAQAMREIAQKAGV